MKTISIKILFFVLALFFIAGCEEKKAVPATDISGHLISNSDCKSNKSGNLKFTVADSLSCVNFNYDVSNHKVSMLHQNAGFNCCPEKIYCDITTNNDTIIILEHEKEQGCNCNCLFDLDIELQGVDPNKYQVRFIEPYADGMEEINFEMDLTSSNTGEFCVVRNGYPWGE